MKEREREREKIKKDYIKVFLFFVVCLLCSAEFNYNREL